MPMEQEKTSHTDYRGRGVSDRNAGDRDVSDRNASGWDSRGQRSSNRVDRGQVGVIVLIVLAVVATVVMLLSNSEVALRLALLASLWSAVIGFFLVTRYRRQAQSAEQRVADHERFVRQQQESARVQSAGTGVSEPQSLADAGGNGIDPERFEQMWESIRAELSVIRTHLEELQDREFGYEPAALQAEARRIRELEQHADYADHAGLSAGYGASSGAPSRDAIAGKLGSQPSQPQPNPLSALISEREQEQQQRETEKPQQPQSAAQKATKPAAAKPTTATPDSRKPTAETSQSVDTGAAKTSAAQSGAAKTSAGAAKTNAAKSDTAKFDVGKTDSGNSDPGKSDFAQQNQEWKSGAGQAADRDTGRSTDPTFDTSRFHAVRWDSTAPKTTTQQPQPAVGAHRDDAEARPHRRRRDENTEGISVAELLKRTQK